MKRVALMIIPALICGVFFSGCSADTAEPQPEKTMGELYVTGTRSVTVSADKPDLVFTGDDIESFNIHSREIVFAKVKADDIRYRIGLFSELYFYLNNELLFDPPLRIHSEVSSIIDVLGLSIWGSKIYFRSHIQNYDFLPAPDREAREKEQAELVQKRQKEMEVFIKYLNDAGKIDKTVPPEIEGVYVGAYTTASSDFLWTTTPTIELKNGEYTYNGLSNTVYFNRGAGNFTIKDDKIIFELAYSGHDPDAPRVDFMLTDWHSAWLLNGEYEYKFDGKYLIFSKKTISDFNSEVISFLFELTKE